MEKKEANFEVESIQEVELPQLFSDDSHVDQLNSKDEKSDKAPELFENLSEKDEDLEIPAFLRRQKN